MALSLALIAIAVSSLATYHYHSNLLKILKLSKLHENLEILCKPNRYVLYWTYNQTDITFEVIVKTNGWISFGLSPDGQIYYSDFVVAWVYPDGTGHFSGIYRIK